MAEDFVKSDRLLAGLVYKSGSKHQNALAPLQTISKLSQLVLLLVEIVADDRLSSDVPHSRVS